jgi:hypothetical protein
VELAKCFRRSIVLQWSSQRASVKAYYCNGPRNSGARRVLPPKNIIALGARTVLPSTHIMRMEYRNGARKMRPPKHIVVALLAKSFRQALLRNGVLQWSSQSASVKANCGNKVRTVQPSTYYCYGALGRFAQAF